MATNTPTSMPMTVISSPLAGGSSDYGGSPLRRETGSTVTAAQSSKVARELSGAAVVRSDDQLTISTSAGADHSGHTVTRTAQLREQDAGFLQGDELSEILPPDYHVAVEQRANRNRAVRNP
ncbi:hypothetical protein DACRYDRAFT_22125 [Dacryopinax primogenitus]|uniref:Uncharacterized protein n=1 Tax=Dacryopinax primogenitus (strain DJM 731) TaxID=1858805 RepID=M5G198_DACPD|nr:uncharacterized protein DACRYDRAFT_22125 [Dacryopinax primogenitus]EJU02504.1 hypothetical protein DACRYDRAFT_22125 [Dacryopinax primogenitus]